MGSGIIKQGIISVTLGTSGVVFAATERFLLEPEGRLHAFCHAVPAQWHLMGVMLSAGGSLRWFRDTLEQTEAAQARAEGRDAYDLICDEGGPRPCRLRGADFPAVSERREDPLPDLDARATFFGLTLRHGKEHMARSVLEGVAYGLRRFARIDEANGPITQVMASGGGARSALWRQILADVFDWRSC